MYNHSDIWQNITMIIFLLFILLILIIKFRIKIYVRMIGSKSEIRVKFLFWEFKRKGKFLIKSKMRVGAKSKEAAKIVDKVVERHGMEDSFADESEQCSLLQWLRMNKSKKIEEVRSKRLWMDKGKRLGIVKHKWLWLRVLKVFRFEKLEINEEVGALEPNITAFAIPLVSLVTTLPLNLLNIDYNNFKYKIVTDYTGLKFNLELETEITFRLFKIIFAIVKNYFV